MRDDARSVPSRALSLALGAAALLFPLFADASYEESHVTGDEVRITVDASGSARVEHAIVWRVVAGHPHGFDLTGTEDTAQPEPAATLESEDGQVIPAMVTLVPGKGLRVSVGEPKALHHGQQYQVHLAYTVNLAATGELSREGTSYRLLWRSPLPPEGYETPRVTFILPPALEPPSALIGEGAMRDDGVKASLKRDPQHDEIDLVRPHVGRGEDVLWAVRVDGRAFEAGHAPRLAPAPPPPRRQTHHRRCHRIRRSP